MEDKGTLESAMRTPGLGGFQLLGFHDHPPQGTSTIGIVTALRKSKGLVTAEQFRRFCGPTVPLARLYRRTFTNNDSLTADVDVAHYGPSDLKNIQFRWQLSERRRDVCFANGMTGAVGYAVPATKNGAVICTHCRTFWAISGDIV